MSEASGEARVVVDNFGTHPEMPAAKLAPIVDSAALAEQLRRAGATPLSSKDPIWIDLRQDLRVQVQEPAGSTQFRAASIVPMESANPSLLSLIQAMLYVIQYQIGDGAGGWKPSMVQAPLKSYAQAQALADLIGDEGLTLLQVELGVRFPASPFTKDRIAKLTSANPNL